MCADIGNAAITSLPSLQILNRRKNFHRLLRFMAQFNRRKMICKKTKKSPQRHFVAAISTECGSRYPFRKIAFPLRTEKLLLNIKTYVEGSTKDKEHQRFAQTSRGFMSSIFECLETNQRYAMRDVKKYNVILESSETSRQIISNLQYSAARAINRMLLFALEISRNLQALSFLCRIVCCDQILAIERPMQDSIWQAADIILVDLLRWICSVSLQLPPQSC